MQKLNLPDQQLKLRRTDQLIQIFDRYRKKYVRLNPEEWVRQNLLGFLVSSQNYPESLIHVEASLKYNSQEKRSDAVVYKGSEPVMIIECKAPEIQLSQGTFDQIARYNFVLRVKYLLVSNGISHFCCKMNYLDNTYNFLKEIPRYEEL